MRCSSDRDSEQQINDALADFLRLSDAGEDVDLDVFISQHTDIAGQLRELLETAGLIEQMAGPMAGKESQPSDDSRGTCRETSCIDEPALIETVGLEHDSRADRLISKSTLTAQEFGDYELQEVIGRGGMGVVYKSRQRSLDRIVAVKMIRSGVLASESDVQRFYNEARAAGRLNHPNIVQVHEVGEVDGQHFFSMDFIVGTDLSKITKRQSLESEQIAQCVKAVAEAIQHAHEHHIVHRDLKPANIIMASSGRPLVTDFGLAKDIEQEMGLTSTGTSLGTPAYMSPEQAAGKTDVLGKATDIYSLGAILYELLTGRPPFQADSTVNIILDVIHREPIAPRKINPKADGQLEAICLKCLHKEPSKRYVSAQALADDLGCYLNGEAILARPSPMASRWWYWVRDIPLVAALVGRRVTNPTAGHRISQWCAVVVLLLLVTAGLFAIRETTRERPFPSQIRIATGRMSGEYHQFASAFGAILEDQTDVPVEILSTEGAVENQELLLADKADLGMLQASTVSHDELAIVAPLYEEYVYFLARTDSDISRVTELDKKKVLVGAHGSGMRVSARRVLHRLGLSATLVNGDFSLLKNDLESDAAIVTTGSHNPALIDFLLDGKVKFLSLLPDELNRLTRGPVFRTRTIKAGSLRDAAVPERPIPSVDIPTVTTTTFLSVHTNAANDFVHALCQTLYGHSELAATHDLISWEEAAEWPTLPLHPAARRFFEGVADEAF